MESKGMKVLVIDDELQMRKLLLAVTMHPDLVIVDLGLPDMDGKDVVSRLREWSSVPIIVLTAREQEKEKIDALDRGADDYITKPFSMGELMARMRVCLRRFCHSEEQKPLLSCGEISMDLLQHQVLVEGREVKLTPTEYDLLKYMLKNAGKVLTHKQILKAVWGNDYDEDLHYIRIYMRQLRRKIEKDPAQPKYLLTEAGVGYRLSGC